MRDVAALAGVSLKTVSRVVNGEASVGEDLAARVRRAADQLSFKPNLAASSLRRSDRKTLTIGVLLEDVANPFSAAVHRALEDLARSRGVSVLAGSLDESPESERELALNLVARRVDGLVIVPAAADQSYLQSEQRAGMKVVFLDRPPRLLDADSVVSSNTAGAAEGTGHLLDKGHRRVAFLGDLASISTAAQRHAGYVAAHAERGLPIDDSLVAHGLRDLESVERFIRQVVFGDDPPTAIFTGQNLITIDAIRALHHIGQQHRIALVGFDDFLLADLLDPSVTVVAQDPVEMGRQAGALLFARMDGDTAPSRQVLVPTRLVVRNSCSV